LVLAHRLMPIAGEVELWFAQHLAWDGATGATTSPVREATVEPQQSVREPLQASGRQ
jgi:hypothetical protein